MNVIKRNGEVVPFNFENIKNAVNKAFNAVHGADAPDDFIDYLRNISETFTENKTVEEIQNFVIYSLGEFKYFDVQIAYTEYRYKHTEERLIKDRILYMKQYQLNGENAATSSASDPNANMNLKNVANMESEVYKLDNRKTQRIMLYDEISKLYDKELADQYLKDLTSHLIYSHDEASTPVIKNYCEAVTLYPLLEGTGSLDGTSTKAPEHLDSFCGQLVNATFLLASQCKGAVAFGEFFNFFDYYAVKDYGDNYDLHENLLVEDPRIIKNPKTIGQRLEQQFQHIVFNWNQPAGNRGAQSPFTNISYYDENYWHALFDDFTFPDGSKPLWRRIDYLQRKFIHWFNKTRTETLLTFPVETMALLTDGKDVIDKNYKALTSEMYAAGHSFFTYLSDNPDSLASCCFTGKEKIWIIENEHDLIVSDFETAYNNYGQSTIKTYQTDPYTKEPNIVDAEIIKTTTKEWITFNCKVDAILSPEKAVEWYKHCFVSIKVTPDHILPVLRDDKVLDLKAKDITRSDLLLFDARCWQYEPRCKKDRIFTGFICNIEKEELDTEEDCYCFNIAKDSSPYFNLFNGLITHNCRLRNQITENVFSFTNGLTGVQTGSCNVITINLNRLVQNALKGYEYDSTVHPYARIQKLLTEVVERVHKYHIAYKTMLYEWEANGMFTASKAGYISMSKLYSTVGLNGINEAAEFLGLQCTYNNDYKDFCQLITSTISDLNKRNSTTKFQFNTEFVPAESLSSKNYNWDREDGLWVPSDRNLYNSYFYLASDPNTSILDRFKLHGREFTGTLDGGVGLHCNLEEHLSQEQYNYLIDYAIKVGCSYFTFNIPNCQCDKCGHIEKHHFDKCPKCGCEETTDWTRIIGYLRPVPKFDKERYKEALTRIYHPASNLKC